jgi:hypothetical protein
MSLFTNEFVDSTLVTWLVLYWYHITGIQKWEESLKLYSRRARSNETLTSNSWWITHRWFSLKRNEKAIQAGLSNLKRGFNKWLFTTSSSTWRKSFPTIACMLTMESCWDDHPLSEPQLLYFWCFSIKPQILVGRAVLLGRTYCNGWWCKTKYKFIIHKGKRWLKT